MLLESGSLFTFEAGFPKIIFSFLLRSAESEQISSAMVVQEGSLGGPGATRGFWGQSPAGASGYSQLFKVSPHGVLLVTCGVYGDGPWWAALATRAGQQTVPDRCLGSTSSVLKLSPWVCLVLPEVVCMQVLEG